MIESLIQYLESQQSDGSEGIPFGNYPSYRYHPVFRVRRREDNVYFVSWINQLLRKYAPLLDSEHSKRVSRLVQRGDSAIKLYRNRYGELTYNFYRPRSWFPNGSILSRFGRFQPTDDCDDTAIACRGQRLSLPDVKEIKGIFMREANGNHDKWVKQLPRPYRKMRAYNTWIGSEDLYADIDVMVLCTILLFNAEYGLDIEETDEASIDVIIKSALSGELLNKKWSLSAWYPFESVILYGLSELIAISYYPRLEVLKPWLIERLISNKKQAIGVDAILISSSLMKIGQKSSYSMQEESVESFIAYTNEFSFGVIPLTHPWNGLFSQWLSSLSLFRLFYDCPAQRAAILLEYSLLKEEQNQEKDEFLFRKKKEQDPISRIL